nr:hypothetical protein [uncultured Bartonella sp.]
MTSAKSKEESVQHSKIVASPSILDTLLEKTAFTKEQEEYSVAKTGLEIFIGDLLKNKKPDEKVNKKNH